VSNPDDQRVAENQGLGIVEGLTPSKTEENPTSSVSVSTGHSRGYGPPWKKEKIRKLFVYW
jgi:hypothetical protein